MAPALANSCDSFLWWAAAGSPNETARAALDVLQYPPLVERGTSRATNNRDHPPSRTTGGGNWISPP